MNWARYVADLDDGSTRMVHQHGRHVEPPQPLFDIS
jgi:hypothetical protein